MQDLKFTPLKTSYHPRNYQALYTASHIESGVLGGKVGTKYIKYSANLVSIE